MPALPVSFEGGGFRGSAFRVQGGAGGVTRLGGGGGLQVGQPPLGFAASDFNAVQPETLKPKPKP